jgi:4-hydroxythreonine-4-phosphate dehydrogenase
MKENPRLAVTLGDPCGVGPELLLKALPAIAARWRTTVYGSSAGLALLRRETPSSAEYEMGAGRLAMGQMEIPWVDPTPETSPDDLRLGEPSALSGRCAIEAVRSATQDIMAGGADALLTLPLSKAAAHKAGYNIPGHTELLQAITASPKVRMAFVSPRLKVVLHTVHQSLASAIGGLSAGTVADTLVFAAQQFASLLGVRQARIALCALNPHAGEGGAFGSEEKALAESIKIATAFFEDAHTAESQENPKSKDLRPAFSGPWPADTVFLRAVRGEFDAVVALYHDQGLIPIKLVEPECAVNLTLGLPFIRVSPDHGTAFDIAGKWTANPNNALAAAELALSLLR